MKIKSFLWANPHNKQMFPQKKNYSEDCSERYAGIKRPVIERVSHFTTCRDKTSRHRDEATFRDPIRYKAGQGIQRGFQNGTTFPKLQTFRQKCRKRIVNSFKLFPTSGEKKTLIRKGVGKTVTPWPAYLIQVPAPNGWTFAQKWAIGYGKTASSLKPTKNWAGVYLYPLYQSSWNESYFC